MIKDYIDRAIDDANACDGFRVLEVARGGFHRIYIAFYSNGDIADIPQWHTDATPAIPLWISHNPSPEEIGEGVRIKLFAEAICRFLNSGGDWNDMSKLLDICKIGTNEAMISKFGDFGYRLLDSCINEEGRNEHIFLAHGERRAIRWVEDSFIEALPDYVIAKDLGDDHVGNRSTPGGGFRQEEIPRELLSRENYGDEGSNRQGGKILPLEDKSRRREV